MRRGIGLLTVVGCCVLPIAPPLHSQTSSRDAVVNVVATLDSLICDEDTDSDLRITIDDPRIEGTSRGDRRFTIRTADRRGFDVAGTYYLSNLLQELKLAQESGVDSFRLSAERIFEAPAERISRSIR
ncbi:MAG: hypothetical protein HY708_07485, partial [Ignavibacteriae bacterium]|nr:hypothetical protein [Ignavibacteriota bacterium]